MSSQAAEQLVSMRAAARAFGISYNTFRRLVAAGKIPSVSVAGETRLRLSEVRQTIQDRPAIV